MRLEHPKSALITSLTSASRVYLLNAILSSIWCWSVLNKGDSDRERFENITQYQCFACFSYKKTHANNLQRNVRQPGPVVVAPDICFLGFHSPLVWNEFLRNSAYLLNSELKWGLSFLFWLQKSATCDNDEVVHCRKTINKTNETKTDKITISEEKFHNL